MRFRCCLIGLIGLSACTKPAEKQVPSASPVSSAPAPVASASAGPPPTTPVVTAKRPSQPLNVLFLTIDSLRADMPWTGYSRNIAPNLSRLAEQGVVYPRAYAISSYTAKSVAGFLTGRFPSTLYRDGSFFAGYAKSNLFLSEVLSEHGLRSTSWHSHLYFGRGKGLDQGFSEWRLVPKIGFDPETDTNVTSEKMTVLGQELLGNATNVKEPFFAWAHYMDPHDEYKKHPESPDFGKKNRDRYDSEVFYTDLWIGKLLDWAALQPWWKNTVVIVSADHGEAFGEHGVYKHAFALWEVLVRVPLIVKGPEISPKRIEMRRSMLDLAPTVLDLMGLEAPRSMFGRSFANEVYGVSPADDREPIICELAEDIHNPPRKALIQGDYKLVEISDKHAYELYNLHDDPDELHNLATTERKKADELKRELKAQYEKLPTVEPYGGTLLKSGRKAKGPVGP